MVRYMLHQGGTGTLISGLFERGYYERIGKEGEGEECQ